MNEYEKGCFDKILHDVCAAKIFCAICAGVDSKEKLRNKLKMSLARITCVVSLLKRTGILTGPENRLSVNWKTFAAVFADHAFASATVEVAEIPHALTIDGLKSQIASDPRFTKLLRRYFEILGADYLEVVDYKYPITLLQTMEVFETVVRRTSARLLRGRLAALLKEWARIATSIKSFEESALEDALRSSKLVG